MPTDRVMWFGVSDTVCRRGSDVLAEAENVFI